MKVGDWWVHPGVLSSGTDPAAALATAGFPAASVPMVYMMGDGHASPWFQWADRGVWTARFAPLVAANKVCVHVETFQNKVDPVRLPASLRQVFVNRKMFGWEPELYAIISGILERIMEVGYAVEREQRISRSDLRFLTWQMYLVHDNGYLRPLGDRAMRYWEATMPTRTRPAAPDPVPLTILPNFSHFLGEYLNAAGDNLRTEIHPLIAAMIQPKIEEFPDHAHLIACGEAHVTINPLYGFIRPAAGTFGIADPHGNVT